MGNSRYTEMLSGHFLLLGESSSDAGINKWVRMLFTFPSEELCNVMGWERNKDLLYTKIPALAL